MKKLFLLLALMMSVITTQAQDFAVEKFQTQSGKNISVTLIKHASMEIRVDDYIIQVDPVSRYTDYSKFGKADLILICHEHGDHMDPKAVEPLLKESTLIYANQRSLEKLPARTVALENGSSVRVNDYLNVDAVPAYNLAPENLQKHPKGVGNGYVLTIDGFRIYIAGDLDMIPELKDIKDIDLCFLPINGPTMTPEQAVEAALLIEPKIFIPYHFSNTNVQEVKEKVDAAGKKIEVRLREML